MVEVGRARSTALRWLGPFMVLWVALCLPTSARADIRDCPTGQVFDRRFAACVQANCDEVPDAHYAHGGECVCSTAGSIVEKRTDPTKACPRPSTYASCPGCVYKCVLPGEPCETPSAAEVCEERCAEYHSAGVRAKVVDGKCSCVCKDGYAPDGTLTCKKLSPAAACEQSCAEYHSPAITPVLIAGVCNCVCKDGWAPDDTLTCKKVGCDDLCTERLGEHGVPEGQAYPDCGCTCEPGTIKVGSTCLEPETEPDPPPPKCPANAEPDSQRENCWCRHPFKPVPENGRCVRDPRANCPDKFCDRLGRSGTLEDCEICPEDCGCPGAQFCAPKIGLESAPRCRAAAAKLVDWGCNEGDAQVRVMRGGREVELQRGLWLTPGDTIRFELLGCGGGFATFEWGGVRGKVLYPKHSPELHHTITIREDSISSGWPRFKGEKGEVVWRLVLDEMASRLIALLTGPLAPIVGFGMGAGSSAGSPVFVWIKSELVIVQRSDGTARVMTQSGSPQVQLGDGPRTLVAPGQAVDADGAGVGTPTGFTQAEIDALEAKGFSWCDDGRERDGLTCTPAVPRSKPLADLLAILGIAILSLSGLLLAFAASRGPRT